jgi:hypothetical protein
VDGQPKVSDARSGRVIVVDSEIAESGWLTVDLALYEAIPRPPGAPQFERPAAPAKPESSPARTADTEQQAFIRARLVAWAGRLRARETTPPDGHPNPAPDHAPDPPVAPLRRVPRPDIIKIDRKPIRALTPPGSARLLAAPAMADEGTSGSAGKPRSRSRRVRILLLALAAAYLVAGLAHSLTRLKPTRAIVVPATADDRTVIT